MPSTLSKPRTVDSHTSLTCPGNSFASENTRGRVGDQILNMRKERGKKKTVSQKYFKRDLHIEKIVPSSHQGHWLFPQMCLMGSFGCQEMLEMPILKSFILPTVSSK